MTTTELVEIVLSNVRCINTLELRWEIVEKKIGGFKIEYISNEQIITA
jgi:hypothetical protein